MNNFDRIDFNQIFRERTKSFSIAIIKTLSSLPYSDDISIIGKQIFGNPPLSLPITEQYTGRDPKKKSLLKCA